MSLKNCAIPTVYCGKKKIPSNTNEIKYTKKGSRDECLRKGFGAGQYSEKLKNLPSNSLQRIKYVGDKYETEFRRYGIGKTTTLIRKCSKQTKEQNTLMLKKIFLRKDGIVDKKGYNSTILFLSKNGVATSPTCLRIS